MRRIVFILLMLLFLVASCDTFESPPEPEPTEPERPTDTNFFVTSFEPV